MSKLNASGTHPRAKAAVSSNGNVQDKKSHKHLLLEIMSGCLFGKNNFYTTTGDAVNRMIGCVDELVRNNELDFIANAIVFSRQKMNIRTMPIVATVQFAKCLRDQKVRFAKMRLLVSSVIQRADQITDLLNYAVSVFGGKKNVPVAIKRGVADAFNNFNEYHFAKYNRANEMKFTDAMRIVHPVPRNDHQSVLFDKIMNDSRAVPSANGHLQTPDTWEVALSSGTESKSAAWTRLILEEKLGYTALLKNLRNINEHCSKETIKHAANQIRSPIRIEKGRVLPFELVQAYQHCGNNALQVAVNDAIEHSLKNLGRIAKRIWILLDASGSMTSNGVNGEYARTSGFSAADIGAIFAAGILKSAAFDNEDDELEFALTYFHSTANQAVINPNDSFMSIREIVRTNMRGGSTNLAAGLNMLSKLKFTPDVVIVISDMQVNSMGSFDLSKIPGIKIALNVSGTESTPVSDIRGWAQVSGLSTNTLDFIKQAANRENYVQMLQGEFVGKFE